RCPVTNTFMLPSYPRVVGSTSYDELAGVERFGPALWSIALDGAHRHDSAKRLGPKPRAPGLGVEMLDEQLDLAVGDALGKGNEHVGRPEVPLVLGDFVLQNHVASERVPRELGHEPVVLVHVLSAMAKNDVGDEHSLHLLEEVF